MDWQMFGLIMTIVLAFDAISLFANRFILTKTVTTHEDQYKDKLDAAAKECGDLADRLRDYQSVERQLLELKANLPIDYVRKEDFIRYELIINTKLDRTYEKLDRITEALGKVDTMAEALNKHMKGDS